MEVNELFQPFYIRVEFPKLRLDGSNPRVSHMTNIFDEDFPVYVWVQVKDTIKSDAMDKLSTDSVESALLVSTYRYLSNRYCPIKATNPITYKYARKNGMRSDNVLVLADVSNEVELRKHFVEIFQKSVQLGNPIKNLPWNLLGISWFQLFNKINNIPSHLVTRR